MSWRVGAAQFFYSILLVCRWKSGTARFAGREDGYGIIVIKNEDTPYI